MEDQKEQKSEKKQEEIGQSQEKEQIPSSSIIQQEALANSSKIQQQETDISIVSNKFVSTREKLRQIMVQSKQLRAEILDESEQNFDEIQEEMLRSRQKERSIDLIELEESQQKSMDSIKLKMEALKSEGQFGEQTGEFTLNKQSLEQLEDKLKELEDDLGKYSGKKIDFQSNLENLEFSKHKLASKGFQHSLDKLHHQTASFQYKFPSKFDSLQTKDQEAKLQEKVENSQSLQHEKYSILCQDMISKMQKLEENSFLQINEIQDLKFFHFCEVDQQQS